MAEEKHENEPDALSEKDKKALDDKQAKEKLNDETNASAERLEKANKETSRLNKETAAAKNEEEQGGESEAGSKGKSEEELVEEKSDKECDDMLEGTGLDYKDPDAKKD